MIRTSSFPVFHGTNVSGERQRPGTLVPWSASGAGPQAKPKAPAVIVSLIAGGRLVLCCDARIPAEDDDVLRRPVFAFEEENIASFLAQIQAQGELVAPVPLSIGLRDEDDEPFLEVAAAARVEFLVTDNLRHFPEDGWNSTRIVSPREFLDRFDGVR